MDEPVDILTPPLFELSGTIKTRQQAYSVGDWIPTFNLWIVRRQPEPAILYQQRSLAAAWEPGKLDVAVGGHLRAGEAPVEGLREAREELGKHYDREQLLPIGRKLHVGFRAGGLKQNNLVHLFLIEDNSALETFALQKSEVQGLYVCPVRELLQAHRDPTYSFAASGIRGAKESAEVQVSAASFPKNWDEYHYKMAVLAHRYFAGEQDLLY